MSIEVGQKVPGKITGITHFGAFVELPEDQTGLIHISEISDSFVKDINDVLAVDEEVEVRVLSMDGGRISLSLREEGAKESTESSRAPRSARPERTPRNLRGQENRQRSQAPRGGRRNNRSQESSGDFDKLMSSFLKDSEDRLASIRRNTEGKRGGRGGRRN